MRGCTGAGDTENRGGKTEGGQKKEEGKRSADAELARGRARDKGGGGALGEICRCAAGLRLARC